MNIYKSFVSEEDVYVFSVDEAFLDVTKYLDYYKMTDYELTKTLMNKVKEETGLDVKNITYFGNQPWPYPSGLMVGFIADYAGGEITLQDEELSSGDFYTRDHLPELPRKLSLARKMIDWWLDCSNK